MTDLAQVVWDCKAIKGMDKFVLMGWAEQVVDGMDVAYCSKTTVAGGIGVSLDTIKRRTHALVAAGWLVDTGEKKQWEPDCWTPIYRINLGKIAELDFGGANCTGGAEKAGVQIAPQGSGSRSSPFPPSFPPSSPASAAADLRSAEGSGKSKAEGQTENPKTEDRKPKVKTCPRCGEPWQRDKNHSCMAKPNGTSMDMDDEFDFDPKEYKRPDPDMGERIVLNEDGSVNLESFFSGGRKQDNMDQAPSQKTVESAVKEGRATPRAAAVHDPPGSAAPPKDDLSCPLCGDPKECIDECCDSCYRKEMAHQN